MKHCNIGQTFFAFIIIKNKIKLRYRSVADAALQSAEYSKDLVPMYVLTLQG
jgi:hypothetical protein